MKKILSLILAISFTFLFVSMAPAADIPMMMNYQGYVEDGSGVAVNGSGYFKFAIVDPNNTTFWSNDGKSTGGSEPVNGVPIPVTDGSFTLKLGDTSLTNMSALPTSTFARQNISVRVWFSTDNVIFERLSPDTQIVSSGFAYKAQTVVDDTVNRITPIGLIAPYFGNPANLPDNWKVCDGSMINDPESPLNGMNLPDLRTKFIRGEEDITRDLFSGLANGGADFKDTRHNHAFTSNPNGSHAHSGAVHSHTLTIEQMPSHNHANGNFKYLLQSNCNATNQDADNTCGEPHLYSQGVILPAGGNQPHAHGLTINAVGDHVHSGTTNAGGDSLQDNRPAFISLHYIIRIK